MDSNSAENESFLHFLVDSLRDFSVDDLDAMNSLDFEFYHHEVQESLLGNPGSHIDGDDIEIKHMDDTAISNKPLHICQSHHTSNPSSIALQKEEKSRIVKIDQNSRNEDLRKKIGNSVKRLRFLARFTELSRRHFFAIEKYYLNCSNNPSAHFDNIPTKSNDRASITRSAENSSRHLEYSGLIHSNNPASNNQSSDEDFSAIDDTKLLYKLQTLMKKTQVSRRIISEAIMKVKKRRQELNKKHEETDSCDTGESIINKTNTSSITGKRKDLSFNDDIPRKRARDSIDKNTSSIANSA